MTEIEDLAKKLKDAQEFGFIINKHVDNTLKIGDDSLGYKTLVEWKRFFYIKIPEDFNPQTIISTAIDIMTKYQIASKLRDCQQASLAVTEQTRADTYHQEFQSARDEHEKKYGKPLAAESCKTAATLAVAGYDGAASVQKIIHNFFSKTCSTLSELRKLLELIGYAVGNDVQLQRNIIIKAGEQQQ